MNGPCIWCTETDTHTICCPAGTAYAENQRKAALEPSGRRAKPRVWTEQEIKEWFGIKTA